MWDILAPLIEDDDPEAVPGQLDAAAMGGMSSMNGMSGTGAAEGRLRELMRDPRYWRDRDPGFVARVASGFERLYPGNA
jgi:hypothetical protein